LALLLLGLGAALFGAMILMPLYFQIVEGSNATASGYKLLPFLFGASALWPAALVARAPTRVPSTWPPCERGSPAPIIRCRLPGTICSERPGSSRWGVAGFGQRAEPADGLDGPGLRRRIHRLDRRGALGLQRAGLGGLETVHPDDDSIAGLHLPPPLGERPEEVTDWGDMAPLRHEG